MSSTSPLDEHCSQLPHDDPPQTKLPRAPHGRSRESLCAGRMISARLKRVFGCLGAESCLSTALPRLDNPAGQVDLLGDESRARPDETAGAWVQAQGNEPAGDADTTCAANTAITPPDGACAFIAVPPRSQSEEYTPLFARCCSPALSREAHRAVDGTLSATVHPPTHRSEPAPPPSQRVPGREQATTRASPLGSRGRAYPAPSQGRTPRPGHHSTIVTATKTDGT